MKSILFVFLLFPIMLFSQSSINNKIWENNKVARSDKLSELPPLQTDYIGLVITDGYLDTIAFDQYTVIAFVTDFTPRIAIKNSDLWSVWDIMGSHGILNVSLDTVLLNGKIYLQIRYEEGGSSSHYEDIWYGFKIWDLTNEDFILAGITERSFFNITADRQLNDEGNYPENETVEDCHCKQDFEFINSTLIISPKICSDEIRFNGIEEIILQDCLHEIEPGTYTWNGQSWVK